MDRFMKALLAICAAFSLFIIFGLGVAGIVKNLEAPNALETKISLNGLTDYYTVNVDNFKVSDSYLRYYLKDSQDYPVVLISPLSEIDPGDFYIVYNHRSFRLENNTLIVGWEKSAWPLVQGVAWIIMGVGLLILLWRVLFPKKRSK